MSANEAEARRLADEFRARHQLDLRPLGDLYKLIHATLGIDVIAMDADEAEHGLSARDPTTGRVVIAVATTTRPMRQRSSIAHELGHVVAGDLERPAMFRPGERTPPEIRADAFARHLLLPVTALRAGHNVARGQVTERSLSDLVQEFGVSPHIAAIQLRDMDLISAAQCQDWSTVTSATLAARHGWLGQYRSMVRAAKEPRSPQALMQRAVDGHLADVVGLAELARWYGQREADIRETLALPNPATDSAGQPIRSYDADDDWGADAPLFPPDPDTAGE